MQNLTAVKPLQSNPAHPEGPLLPVDQVALDCEAGALQQLAAAAAVPAAAAGSNKSSGTGQCPSAAQTQQPNADTPPRLVPAPAASAP
jgi:hypothetical protein